MPDHIARDSLAEIGLDGVHALIQQRLDLVLEPFTGGRVGEVHQAHAGLPEVGLPDFAIGLAHQIALVSALLEHFAALADIRVDPSADVQALVFVQALQRGFDVAEETLVPLERFSVNGARPETLEPLSHLSQLKQLSLTECGTLDLTPLEGLDQLESLILSSNDRIVSLEPVTKLPALRSLSLSSGTAVPSLEPLAQTNLAVLDLGLGVGQSGLYKEIDYSPLSQLPDLVCLNLTNHTRVTTKFCKQILAHSPDLRFLNIQNTPASEGSALDVEYLRAYTEADLLKRLVNKLRNTFG